MERKLTSVGKMLDLFLLSYGRTNTTNCDISAKFVALWSHSLCCGITHASAIGRHINSVMRTQNIYGI